MKKTKTKLDLTRTTVYPLTPLEIAQLKQVAGAGTYAGGSCACTRGCPTTCNDVAE